MHGENFDHGLSEQNVTPGNATPKQKLEIVGSILFFTLLVTGTSFAQKGDNFWEYALVANYEKSESQRAYRANETNHKDWLYTGLEVSYVSLNIADLITTYYSLANGATEANPLTKLYINNKPLSILIKGSVTAGVLYGLRQVKQENKTLAYLTLCVLNISYGFIVNNNIGVYLEIKK